MKNKPKVILLLMLLISVVIFSGCIGEDEDDDYWSSSKISRQEILDSGEFISESASGTIKILEKTSVGIYTIVWIARERIFVRSNLDNISDILDSSNGATDWFWFQACNSDFRGEDNIGAKFELTRKYYKKYIIDDGYYYDTYWDTNEYTYSTYKLLGYDFNYRNLYFEAREHFEYIDSNFTCPETIELDMSDSIDKYGASIYSVYNITIPISTINSDLDYNISNLVVRIKSNDKFVLTSDGTDKVKIIIYGSEPGKHKHAIYTVNINYLYRDWIPICKDSYNDHLRTIGTTKIIIDLGLCKKPVEVE